MSNPADNTYAIIEETVAGTTPATPALKYADIIPGTDLTFDMKTLTSETLRQNRDMAGIRKNAGSVGGGLKFEFRQDDIIDLLMKSAISGTTASAVTTAGNTDTSYTVERRLKEGAGFQYFRHTGVQTTKMNLTVDAEGKAQCTFDMVGQSFSTATAIITGATYAASTKKAELVGMDTGTISVAGLTAVYQSLEFSVEQARDAIYALGSRDAIAVGTNSNRQAKLTLKLYRTDLSPETLFIPDTPVAVEFTLGAVGTGYKFTMPACVSSAVPKSDPAGSRNIVTVELMATYDNTAGYGLKVTKL